MHTTPEAKPSGHVLNVPMGGDILTVAAQLGDPDEPPPPLWRQQFARSNPNTAYVEVRSIKLGDKWWDAYAVLAK